MKKSMLLALLFLPLLLVISSAVSLIDFTPKADICMQERYHMYNITDINFSYGSKIFNIVDGRLTLDDNTNTTGNSEIHGNVSIYDSGFGSYPIMVYNENGTAAFYIYQDTDADIYMVLKDGEDVAKALIHTSGNSYFMSDNYGFGTNNPTFKVHIIGNASISEIANAGTFNGTNLKVENLEQDLDGTGYQVVVDRLNATTVDTTNLEADNLEQDLDGTGYNITAEFTGWHYGNYDWLISGATEYLAFNGSNLEFNETKLNETIATNVSGDYYPKSHIDNLESNFTSENSTTHSNLSSINVDVVFNFDWLAGLESNFTDENSTIHSNLSSINTDVFNLDNWLTNLEGNFTDQNASDHTSFETDNLSGNLTWTDLYGYPAACPANSAITQLDDSVTCTDSWLDSTGNEIVSNEVNFTGNVTSNAYYAEIYFHNDTGDGEVTVINTQGVYVNLTGFNTSDTSGQLLNGFSWNNNTEDLTANVAGLYLTTFDVSAGNAGVNVEMQFQIQVNGILQENSDAHRKIATGGDVGNCGDTAFIRLAVGDIVELVVRNNDGTDNIESFAASVNLVRIAD